MSARWLQAVCAAALWLSGSAASGEPATVKRYDLEPSQANMEAISRALGVECSYCHPARKPDGTPDYEAPSVRKAISVYMKRHFVDRLRTVTGGVVGCVDCHQGKARFVPRDAAQVPASTLSTRLPRDVITREMRRISDDLGVECDACHRMRDDGRLNASVQTSEKVAAKFMMDHFPGRFVSANRKAITCATCHGGRQTFLPRASGPAAETGSD